MDALYQDCKYGHFQKLEQFLETSNHHISSKDIFNLFSCACIHDNLPLARRLKKSFPNIIPDKFYDYNLQTACYYGHLSVVKWLRDEIDVNSIHPTILQISFEKTCENGHLNCAKWLVKTFKKRTSVFDYSNGFLIACENRHVSVAKWLVNSNHLKDEYSYTITACFQDSCLRGNLYVIKWLLEIAPDICNMVDRQLTINLAKRFCHYRTVVWLEQNFRVEI